MDTNPTHSPIPTTSVEELVDQVVARALSRERLANGKRFSTYYESYGRIVDQLSDLHDALAEFNKQLQGLWDAERRNYAPDEIDERLTTCINLSMYVANCAISVETLLIKSREGVVHPPKGEAE